MKRDVIGQRFGRLLALARKGEVGKDRNFAVCLCDCGKSKTVYAYSLLNSDTTSCGCFSDESRKVHSLGMKRHVDLTGQRFGRLTVISHAGTTTYRSSKWNCKCDCGNEVTTTRQSLVVAGTKSCGCLQKEAAKRTMTKHGHYLDRDYINELCDARRAMKSGAFVERVFRATVYGRDMGLCQICGLMVEDGEFSLDHRIPLFKGGEHSYANCRTSHASCNFKKGIKLPEDCTHLWRRS